MDTTPEEETNPVVIAFKKITTQLEKLDERDKRAEAREREAQEREQALIEQHNKVSLMMVKIVGKANDFQQNMDKVETGASPKFRGHSLYYWTYSSFPWSAF